MSTKNVRDEEFQDQACDITARFPEIHDPYDCLETVRLIRGLFDNIIEREGVSETLEGPALDEPTYSVADAEKLSKKLRALAHGAASRLSSRRGNSSNDSRLNSRRSSSGPTRCRTSPTR
jgi:hypothetical protein